MPTVSNTSPLLNLAIIGQLELVKVQFGQVLIPQAVLRELRVEEALPGTEALREAISEGWIEVQELEDRALVTVLRTRLDAGESAAIALATVVEADHLLLDERDARQAAKALGLNVTGVLGILLRAKERALNNLSRSKLKARLTEPHNAQVIALSVLNKPVPSRP